jgi:hypothetical protein
MVAMFSLRAFSARPTAMPRRRRLLGAVLGVVLATTACTGSLGPRSITLSLDQMQEKLGQRFPRRYPLAGLIELNLQVPRLRLLPEQNRINAVVTLEASGAALRRVYNGSLDVDFALRFDPADQTVRATDLQVHALQIDGLPPQASQLLGSLGSQLVQQALREVVLHQLQPRDLAAVDRLGLQPGRMTVTPQGLVIELVPRPQS